MSYNFSFNLDTITNAAQNVIETYADKKIFALHGNMGVGKTTFIKTICKILGVTETVNSPTYGIIAEYKGFYNSQEIQIAHMDWYRLKNTNEAFDAGVLEYLQNNSIYCFIEWPSIASEILPINTLHLQIDIISETERIVSEYSPIALP
jgi:tRNA threonylcarbamoyladenosine biosynthesis protein TsaE